MEDKELARALAELEFLEQIQNDRRRKNGIQYYIPNAMQYKAHGSKAEIILYCGGNRAGKSTFGAVELVWHLTRNYPPWYPKERKYKKPIKAVVVATENAIIDKVIEPKIRQYIPLDYVEQWKRVTGNYLQKITCKDGSTVDFLTGEQDNMAFESQDWDFYWGDEPQQKRKFDAIMRGLVDRGGKTVLTFTPLIEPWMKEQLVDKAGQNLPGEPTIDTYIVDMRDNKFDIEGNAILSEENIQKLTSLWDEDTKETRLHGKFFHLRGIVYTEFSEVHQIEFEYTYPDPVIAVLDPHDRQPHHVIWAIIDRHDDIFVHSEFSMHCTVEELARHMRRIESKNGYKMKKRLIDPNFGRKPLITTGRNLIQELSISGCGGWIEADDPKEEGRLKVKEYLHFDRNEPISHTNSPKLFFHRQRTPITIHSIRNHQYEEWIGRTGDDKDPKEKTKDKETHGADCIRYLCMSNPRFDRMRDQTYELEEAPY